MEKRYAGKCSRLKFDRGDKWIMLKPESFQEIEPYKIPWRFEIQMQQQVDFTVPGDNKMTMKESQNIDKYVDFAI